jgi:phosphatidylinositol alpha 1,6-mannosyltransferase
MPPLSAVPRVAFFPDSFHEVNGVAHTARQLSGWAARRGYPFLCIAGSAGKTRFDQQGSLSTLELHRGRASFPLDKDLRYDLLFARHARRIRQALQEFRPDIIHITGPSELGTLGAIFARMLRIPLAASWHTNVHEYAARRSAWAFQALSARRRVLASRCVERSAFQAAALFYRCAQVLFAPNPRLCSLLAAATGRPCRLMTRGIDAQLFSPAHRTAPPAFESGVWMLGYVGRLSIEKNIMLLPRIAQQLNAGGHGNIRFLFAGQGVEEHALRQAMPDATFTGVLRGEALAQAYSNMDCFLFPSHTDTFGNVVLEAMASGVPAIVTPDGGPVHIVEASAGGGVVVPDHEFAGAVASLLADRAAHSRMRLRARAWAETQSWDAVFEALYAGYAEALQAERDKQPEP